MSDKCNYCGSEMKYYDGGDPGTGQETWSCTECDHVCFINSETGEIECDHDEHTTDPDINPYEDWWEIA